MGWVRLHRDDTSSEYCCADEMIFEVKIFNSILGEKIMANLSSWKIKSNSKNNSDELLRVRPDCKLKVRLIGQPVKIVRVFTNERKSIVIDNEAVGQQLKDKYPDRIGNISVRYASWCIDRDSNSMRILDMPKSVARTIGRRVEMVGKKISGNQEGCDFAITTNGKKGKDVRYEVVYLEETPLTQAEQEMVKDRMADKESFDLTKVFKSDGFKEAEEKLLGGVSYVKVIA